MPIGANHGAHQEGHVPAEARVGVQTGGQLLKAPRGSDRKPFFLQQHLQILDMRLKALRYLDKLRLQEHLA